MALRDRLLTPKVARAMFSPLGIVLAGAGAAVGIVSGLGIPAAVGLAAAAWAARVAAAVPARARGATIDPYALVEPWRRFVLHAQKSRNRFEGAVGTTPAGPIRDRMQSIAGRIEAGVEDVWRVANRGQALARARGQLDPQATATELERTQAEWVRTRSPHLAAAVESMRAQLASAQRMARTVTEAEQQLRLLDARLDEAVARAIELSVGTGDEASLSGLDDDVGDIVNELESLRLALEETDRAQAPSSSSSDLAAFDHGTSAASPLASPAPPPDEGRGTPSAGSAGG